mgnify:CR=1 FL=1
MAEILRMHSAIGQETKEVAQLIGELCPTATFTGPRGGLMDGRSDCLAIGHYAINNI